MKDLDLFNIPKQLPEDTVIETNNKIVTQSETVQDLDFKFPEIDFENIKSTQNREKKFKIQIVMCPCCEHKFKVQI
jgi:hypothetical protein